MAGTVTGTAVVHVNHREDMLIKTCAFRKGWVTQDTCAG